MILSSIFWHEVHFLHVLHRDVLRTQISESENEISLCMAKAGQPMAHNMVVLCIGPGLASIIVYLRKS